MREDLYFMITTARTLADEPRRRPRNLRIWLDQCGVAERDRMRFRDNARLFVTAYSFSTTAISTAVGTATIAPIMPASADPSSSAIRIVSPARSTCVLMILGVSQVFSTCR